MAVPFVDLRAQHAPIRGELDAAIARVVESSRFVLGPEVEAFEAEYAEYCGVRHCIGVASGTDALVLALRACGVGPGDEVITPSHTFIAGPLSIASLGAIPVFVDVDETTYLLDPERAAAAITPRTRAIVPVHLYGRCLDLQPFVELAERHGLRLIEDAAQAHGARRDGRAAGSVGHVGCFSFYPAKNLGAFGDAGAIVTNDDELATRLRLLHNHGQTEKYRHDSFGLNSRLDELQAAVLRAQLPALDGWNASRRAVAAVYTELIDERFAPPAAAGEEHVFHLYVVRSAERDRVAAELAAAGIDAQVHYPGPSHLQPVFRDVRHVAHELAVSERVAAEVLSLPMFPTLAREQVERVASTLNAL